MSENEKPDKVKAEREKGAAPPSYMSAIFGWMTPDAQKEHANEIVDFLQELEKEKKNEKNN